MTIRRIKQKTDAAKYFQKRKDLPAWLKERLADVQPDPCKKVKYKHQETADRAAGAMQRKTRGDRMESYHCEQCQAWHIGHSNTITITVIENAN